MSGKTGTSHSKSGVVGKSQDTAKAWVNFDGSGTVAIRGSYNVSSIVDAGVGSYRVELLNAMPNTNYAIAMSASSDTAPDWITGLITDWYGQDNSFSYRTVTAFRIGTMDSAGVMDPEAINAIVFGD